MKIYKLTGFNMSKQYTIEESYFTSLKKASQSLSFLTAYLLRNHDINDTEVFYHKIYTTGIHSKVEVGGQFLITIIEHELKTKVLAYH
jgi:hypothetical protein